MTNLVGPMPETPEYPTPWVADGSAVVADNGLRVALVPFDVSESHAADVARLIADAVNEKYGRRPAADEDGPTPAPLRGFVDRDGDTWFEVEQGLFVCRSSRESAREWFHQRLEEEGVRVGLTAEGLADRYGPLREVFPSDTMALRDARGREAMNEKYGEESPVAEDDEPKPGDRVRVVECCPGNTEAGCTSLVGETGVLKAMSDIKRVPYYVRFDSGGYETVHNVAKV